MVLVGYAESPAGPSIRAALLAQVHCQIARQGLTDEEIAEGFAHGAGPAGVSGGQLGDGAT